MFGETLFFISICVCIPLESVEVHVVEATKLDFHLIEISLKSFGYSDLSSRSSSSTIPISVACIGIGCWRWNRTWMRGWSFIHFFIWCGVRINNFYHFGHKFLIVTIRITVTASTLPLERRCLLLLLPSDRNTNGLDVALGAFFINCFQAWTPPKEFLTILQGRVKNKHRTTPSMKLL